MTIVQGIAEVVKEQTEINGKVLRSPLYSIKLDNGLWYSFGFKNPGVSQYDSIEFEATNGKFGWEGVSSSVVTAEGKKASGAKGTGKALPSDQRQTSIVYQSQHRDAITAVSFAIENKLVKLPAKQSAQYDVFLELVKDLTVQWCNEALQPDLSTPEEVPFEVDEDE